MFSCNLSSSTPIVFNSGTESQASGHHHNNGSSKNASADQQDRSGNGNGSGKQPTLLSTRLRRLANATPLGKLSNVGNLTLGSTGKMGSGQSDNNSSSQETTAQDSDSSSHGGGKSKKDRALHHLTLQQHHQQQQLHHHHELTHAGDGSQESGHMIGTTHMVSLDGEFDLPMSMAVLEEALDSPDGLGFEYEVSDISFLN